MLVYEMTVSHPNRPDSSFGAGYQLFVERQNPIIPALAEDLQYSLFFYHFSVCTSFYAFLDPLYSLNCGFDKEK